MLRITHPGLALALLWITVGSPYARAAHVRGVVQEVTKDSFTLKTERAGVMTFKVGEKLLRDEPDFERIMYNGKFADLKKGMWIEADVRREGKVDVCMGIGIVYGIEEGVILDTYEDAFTLRNDQKKSSLTTLARSC